MCHHTQRHSLRLKTCEPLNPSAENAGLYWGLPKDFGASHRRGHGRLVEVPLEAHELISGPLEKLRGRYLQEL
jgi:hypothetical protein